MTRTYDILRGLRGFFDFAHACARSRASDRNGPQKTPQYPQTPQADSNIVDVGLICGAT